MMLQCLDCNGHSSVTPMHAHPCFREFAGGGGGRQLFHIPQYFENVISAICLVCFVLLLSKAHCVLFS